MATDGDLLQSYARTGDPEAFRQLVNRHAGMVYGTALRITCNPHDAEDVTQDCFLQLARHAAKAARAAPAWLHRTARNRALNLVRDRATRARNEPKAAPRPAAAEPSWQEIASRVDAALDGLPRELRGPLVAHFLEGRTQVEIAGELGVDQSTVSRRLDKGLAQLRVRLSNAGLAVPARMLAGTLIENSPSAAPPALTSALAKLGLAGSGSAGTVAASGAVGMAKVAVAVGGTAVAVGLALATFARSAEPEPAVAAAPAPAQAAAPEPQTIEIPEGPAVASVKPEDAVEGGRAPVEPTLVDMDEMTIVGVAEKGADIGALWQRFEAGADGIANRVQGVGYELHWYPAGEHDWQDVTVMVGVQLTEPGAIPDGMAARTLPASRYAVFTHRLAEGGYEGANAAMDAWLEAGPYRLREQLSIQRYDSRFKGGDDPESEIDFLLPVVPRE